MIRSEKFGGAALQSRGMLKLREVPVAVEFGRFQVVGHRPVLSLASSDRVVERNNQPDRISMFRKAFGAVRRLFSPQFVER
jgi:hypothetical protein